MKYKEFRTGILQTGIANQRVFEETCSEYTIAAMDILNLSASAMKLTNIGGWVSRSAYGTIAYNITTEPSDYTNSWTAAETNNVARPILRMQGISTSPAGTIAANNQASIAIDIKDIQIMFFNASRTAIGDCEIMGIMKGGIEGISALFDTGLLSSAAPSAWIDCRAYSTVSLEINNTSLLPLTGLTLQPRRHEENIPSGNNASSFSLPFTSTTNTNPVVRIQQIINGSPSATSANGRTVFDINVIDLHSFRFAITGGGCRVRGILKG